jgi:transketolase
MRDEFIKTLTKCATTDDSIILIVGDVGYGVVDEFRDTHPMQFYNAGVSEQNMAGMAAGLASEGFKVFTYSIGNFPSFRCAEQIRNDIAYHNLPVTTVAVGGGLSYGNMGYSHHAVQDFAFFRTLPNLLIASPADPIETKLCVEYLIKNPQPSYLRLGKSGEQNLNKNIPNISPGNWNLLKSGKEEEKCIICAGAIAEKAMAFCNNNSDLKNVSVFSMPLWSMACKSDQIQKLRAYKKIIVIEEHIQDGGFASWLAEATFGNKIRDLELKSIAIKDSILDTVGDRDHLLQQSDFTEEQLVQAVLF